MDTTPALPVESQRYLERLADAARALPPAHRASLLEQIGEHLEEATAEGAPAAETLAALGSPESVVAAARAEALESETDAPSAPVPWRRWLLWLSVASALVAGLGVVGVVLGALLSARGLLTVPSLLLLVVGLTSLLACGVGALLLRRTAGSDDREVLRRPALLTALVLASMSVTLGAAGVLWGFVVFAMTNNPRSVIILAPTAVLLVAGAVGLAVVLRRLSAPAPRRPGRSPAPSRPPS